MALMALGAQSNAMKASAQAAQDAHKLLQWRVKEAQQGR